MRERPFAWRPAPYLLRVREGPLSHPDEGPPVLHAWWSTQHRRAPNLVSPPAGHGRATRSRLSVLSGPDLGDSRTMTVAEPFPGEFGSSSCRGSRICRHGRRVPRTRSPAPSGQWACPACARPHDCWFPLTMVGSRASRAAAKEADGGLRTHDLQHGKLMLYQTELRPQ